MTLQELLTSPSQFQLDKVQFNFPSEIKEIKVQDNILVVLLSKILWIDLTKPDSVVELLVKDAVRIHTNGSICIFETAKNVYLISPSQKQQRLKLEKFISIQFKENVFYCGFESGLLKECIIESNSIAINTITNFNEPIYGIQFFKDLAFISTKSKLFTMTSTFQEIDVQEMDSKLGVKIYNGRIPYLVWLTDAGILLGTIKDTGLTNVIVIPYPFINDEIMDPVDFLVCEFHVLLQSSKGCVVVNRFSTESVELKVELSLGEKVVCLASDPVNETFWIATNMGLYEVIVDNEQIGIVELLVQKRQFQDALAIATETEKQWVAGKYADDCFLRKEYEVAATLYAQSGYWFEKVMLKFMELDKMYLISFLKKKLQMIDGKSQVVMIFSLLVETILSEIDAIQYSPQPDATLLQKHRSTLNDLIRHYKSQFHAPTIYSLLKQHGNETSLLYTAELLKDDSLVVEIHVKNKNWSKALEVLGKQTNVELYYRYGPVLIQNAPNETITLWSRCEFLNPRLLIPAMLYYKSSGQVI